LTFIKVVKATFKFQTYYKPPSYHGLHIYLLKQSKLDVSRHIYERTQNSIHKYEATIYSNGWDNVAWRPLLNTMFVYSNGDVFVGAVDTTRGCKDAWYIFNALVRYIESVRIDNIIQMCIDNASSMRNVIDLLLYHFPSLYF